MDSNTIQILIAMVVYMAAVIGIGIVFAKRANTNSENYFLGGRSLGPWVTAMSAEASDMSGWLLMGLPGVAYWCGLADAAWTAIGLAIGTYFKLLRKIISHGQQNGVLRNDVSTNEILKAYALFERALLYDWCLCNGNYSLFNYSQSLMPMFLDGFRV